MTEITRLGIRRQVWAGRVPSRLLPHKPSTAGRWLRAAAGARHRSKSLGVSNYSLVAAKSSLRKQDSWHGDAV